MRSFVKRLLGGSEPDAAPIQPAIPAGRRLYSIGDIHGRLDLLEELHGMIREDSAGFKGNKIVVHGHSISDEVEWLPNRIGIDTGAYQSGLLTALVLEGSEQRLLQTGRGCVS